MAAPQFKYWLVNIQTIEEDGKGKIKKNKETHLVDAYDVKEVEEKVKKMMEGETRDWNIQSINSSQIIEVY